MKLEEELSVNNDLLTAKKLESKIAEIIEIESGHDHTPDTIDAIMYYIEENNLDIEDILPIIKQSKCLVEKIHYDALNRGVLKEKTGSLLNFLN